jgi:hypothetical protein
MLFGFRKGWIAQIDVQIRSSLPVGANSNAALRRITLTEGAGSEQRVRLAGGHSAFLRTSGLDVYAFQIPITEQVLRAPFRWMKGTMTVGQLFLSNARTRFVAELAFKRISDAF